MLTTGWQVGKTSMLPQVLDYPFRAIHARADSAMAAMVPDWTETRLLRLDLLELQRDRWL